AGGPVWKRMAQPAGRARETCLAYGVQRIMRKNTKPFRPALENLEERTVPYALSGSQWANLNVSASFMPDGTITDNGAASNLFATMNARFPTATWQTQFARALQSWADVSPLNF